jgi:pimeloyl-ACP methyl ester carboxylesterase
MTTPDTSVLFIHGLWLHAKSWDRWIAKFRERGYDPRAPGWPGEPATVEEARLSPDLVADRGIDDLMQYVSSLIKALPSPPVLIGHSFGGLLVEKLLGEGYGLAGVAIDPAQIKGVLPLPLAQLKAGFPALGNPFNKHKAISLTEAEFRYGFGNALSEEESNELFHEWSIPSPVRGLFEVALANFTFHPPSKVQTDNATRGPLLLISGTADHTAPDVTTRAAYKLYRHSTAVTELKQFEGRGHSLTVDHGWSEVADAILAWLDSQSLNRNLSSSSLISDRNQALRDVF